MSDRRLLNKMGSVITYRGPDSSGSYVDEDISLGHRRLSIIDLNTGQQPIFNENKSVVIVYNGEIYNFKELRQSLEEKGHRFYTNTDTEVIVHAYEEYGTDAVEWLHGMFAFALWDSKKRILFLARDRLGIKPLYYIQLGETFLFASEIKSLLQYAELPRELNYNALNNFLTFRYVPLRDTMIAGVRKLEPGTTLTFCKGVTHIRRYWELSLSTEPNTLQFYSKKLRQALEAAVKSHLMSDVPLGALLSGGIDSSVVVSLMAEFAEAPKTFIVGFEEEQDNEFRYARAVAERYDTDHHEIMVKQQTYKLLPEVTWFMDEPLGDLTKIPAYCIYREAKRYVTVLLTGEGGDELFGGYEQHKILRLTKRTYDRLPNLLREQANGVIKKVSSESAFRRLSDYLGAKSEQRRYIELVAMFGRAERQRLFSTAARKKVDIDSDIASIKKSFNKEGSISDKVFLNEIRNWLPNDHLLRCDRMTMAHSIEGRVPLLDDSVVSLALKIPFGLKLHGNTEKYILRHCMKDRLPKIVFSRKKQRFFTPIDSLFGGEFNDIAKQILSESSLAEKLYNRAYVKRLFDYRKSISYKLVLSKNKLLRQYYARQLWLLVSLEIWNKIFIEGVSYKKLFN